VILIEENISISIERAIKVAQFNGGSGPIYTLEHAKEPHLFYSGSGENLVVKWNLNNPQDSNAIVRLTDKAYALKLIYDKNILLIGSYSGNIHVIDLEKNKEIELLKLHNKTIYDISYLAQKQQFFVLSADGSLSVWSAIDYSLIKTITFNNQKLRCIDFNSIRNEAVIGCSDGSIRIIELENYTEIGVYSEHMEGFSVFSAKYHPNGKLLFTGSRDAHLNIWDPSDNYSLADRIPAHNYAIYSIVFRDDAKLLATGSRDKTIRIWDSTNAKLLHTISQPKYDGHTHSVNKLIWSSHNNYLISTGDDKTIKAWDLKEI